MTEGMRAALVRRLVGSCAVLLAATVAVGSVARPGPSVTAASTQEPTLTDDDGGAALFDIPALAPGQRVERCIRVQRDDGLGRVRLAAAPRGPLAAAVNLAVARGEGSSRSSCDDFAGTVVYRGTLAGAATGLDDADWGGAGAGRVTYRFVLHAPADLSQDAGEARVAFHWTAQAAGGDREEGPPEVGDGPGDEPASTPDSGRTTVADATPPARPVLAGTAVEATRSPAAAAARQRRSERNRSGRKRSDPRRGDRQGGGKRTPDATTPAGGGGPAPSGDGRDSSGLGATLRKIVSAVAQAAVEGAKRVAFPLLLLIAMGLFMLFQNRLDSRDPKLALAPVLGSPDLAFPDPDADEGRKT